MKQYLNTTLRNIAWFKSVHDMGQLDMKPDFQRNTVWSNKQKSYLIDTILRGYPIPEIYMQEIIYESGESEYLIVDGKQRITSILEFMDDKFKLDKKDSPEWANLKFSELRREEKKIFYEYNFVIRLLPEMQEDEIRSIFQRLNRNVASLNSQELRQATYWGEFITLINKIASMDIWSKIDIFSSNDIRRMLDAEYISELVVAMLHGLQNKKDKLDDYYKIYEEEFNEKDKIFDEFNYVLKRIVDLIPNINETRWNKKTDFYTLFLVLYNHISDLELIDNNVLGDKLMNFAKYIDELQDTANYNETQTYDENILIYSKNIRASSDLGSRRKRHEALSNYLYNL